MEYQSTFSITRQETLRFTMYQMRRTYLKMILVFGVLGAITCWFTVGEYRSEPLYVAAAMALTFLVVVLASLLGHALIARLRVRRVQSYQQEIKITPTGIRVRSQGRERRSSFDKLLDIRETRHAFYLYTDPNNAWIIPKAQMKDREVECAQLRRIFDAIGESARLHLRKK